MVSQNEANTRCFSDECVETVGVGKVGQETDAIESDLHAVFEGLRVQNHKGEPFVSEQRLVVRRHSASVCGRDQLRTA